MIEVHAYVEVTTLDEGIAFYCDGLGLAVKRRFTATWIELAGANLPIYLLGGRSAVADLGSRKATRSFERHWTPVHLDFIVTDLDATVARLTARGATLDREVQVREYGRMANMADPFGNGFDLIELAGAGYDALAR